MRVLNAPGFAPTFDVTATIYWSPPATLVSPYLWEPVGSVVIPTVPGSDVLTVSDAITWPAANIPESGHYCFVGLVGTSKTRRPIPPTSMTFRHLPPLHSQQQQRHLAEFQR